MKKKVLLLIIASFMITGVVSAASLWGTYKGNQIIRLTVDGNAVKVSDAPAVLMEETEFRSKYFTQKLLRTS